jgi:peptide/nickel transport system permease protein
LRHLFLPALPVAFVLFAYLMRMTRTGMIEALESDYVRTAVLKGIPRRRVIVRHALRNALLPTITVIGAQLGGMVGSLLIVETLFNYPGLGQLIVQSAQAHDTPMLEGAALVVALVYMLSNLTADLMYGLLDPRIRRGASGGV